MEWIRKVGSGEQKAATHTVANLSKIKAKIEFLKEKKDNFVEARAKVTNSQDDTQLKKLFDAWDEFRNAVVEALILVEDSNHPDLSRKGLIANTDQNSGRLPILRPLFSILYIMNTDADRYLNERFYGGKVQPPIQEPVLPLASVEATSAASKESAAAATPNELHGPGTPAAGFTDDILADNGVREYLDGLIIEDPVARGVAKAQIFNKNIIKHSSKEYDQLVKKLKKARPAREANNKNLELIRFIDEIIFESQFKKAGIDQKIIEEILDLISEASHPQVMAEKLADPAIAKSFSQLNSQLVEEWFDSGTIRMILVFISRAFDPQATAQSLSQLDAQFEAKGMSLGVKEQILGNISGWHDPQEIAQSFSRLDAQFEGAEIDQKIIEKLLVSISKLSDTKIVAQLFSSIVSQFEDAKIDPETIGRILVSISSLPYVQDVQAAAEKLANPAIVQSFSQLNSQLKAEGMDPRGYILVSISSLPDPQAVAQLFSSIVSQFKEKKIDSQIILQIFFSIYKLSNLQEVAEKLANPATVQSFSQLVSQFKEKKIDLKIIELIFAFISSLPNVQVVAEKLANPATVQFFSKIASQFKAKGTDLLSIANILIFITNSSDLQATAQSFYQFASQFENTKMSAQTIKEIFFNLPSLSDPQAVAQLFSLIVSRFEEAKIDLKIIERILASISSLPDVQAAAEKLANPAIVQAFSQIVSQFKAKGMDPWTIGRILASFSLLTIFLSPQIKEADIDIKELMLVSFLDGYTISLYRLQGPDMSEELCQSYLRNPALLHIRYLLAQENYAELKEYIAKNTIAQKQLLTAIFLNNQSAIISQNTGLIQELAGSKGVLSGMIRPSSKIGEPKFTQESLNSILEKMGILSISNDLELREAGLRLYSYKGKVLVIPLVFDCLLSAYRGSAETDHAEANFITHDLATAINDYAIQGGEASGTAETEPQGANAFHEFDLGFMMLEGRNNRWLDTNVPLAFYYGGIPLPEYLRKRTIILKSDTIVGNIERLTQWQLNERKAKQNIHKILVWMQEDRIPTADLSEAIQIFKEQIGILGNKELCNLKEAYFEAVFGYLDDTFYAALEKEPTALKRFLIEAMNRHEEVIEAAARNNAIPKIVVHPWLKNDKTLLDYLSNEEEIRQGTFDEVDVSTVSLVDGKIIQKSIPAAVPLVVAAQPDVVPAPVQTSAAASNSGWARIRGKKGQDLVNELTKIPTLGGQYRQDALVWEGYSIEQHTVMVLGQFDEYFVTEDLPGGINPDLFRLLLALHDIGKFLGGSNKEEQHKKTQEIITGVIGDLLPEASLLGQFNALRAIISGDPLGEFFKGMKSLEDTADLIEYMANQPGGLSLANFFNLLTIYYQIDAGSYTEDAGGKPSLEYLFAYIGKKKAKEGHRLKFGPGYEEKFKNL